MSDAAPESVKELVERFSDSVYRYAFRLSGSAPDADDLSQETFCRAIAQFKQLRDRSRAKPWLFSIVRNLYLQKLRLAKQLPTLPIDIVGDLPDNAPEAVPEVDTERLQQTLGELPEVFRTPLILYYFEDFSYRDIAEQMDVPIGTVMSRLARARKFLRYRLFPELMPPPIDAAAGPADFHHQSNAG